MQRDTEELINDIFHRKSWWLSGEKLLSRLVELQDVIRILFEEEGNELDHKFKDIFIMKLTNLSDMC